MYFLTAEALSKADSDTNYDLYDAHECTTESPCPPEAAEPPQPCGGETSCKGKALVAPVTPSGTATSSGPGNLAAPTGAVLSQKVTGPPPPPKPLTRAQKLEKALKACKKDRNKHKRASCEKQARQKYGPKHSAEKKTMNQRKALFAAARAGVLVLVVMASTLIAASSASALPTEAAWWQLDSRTAPKFLPPGGNGVIEASATNLGDAGVAGTAGTPLKLTDAVPAGLEVTKLKVTAGTEENPLLLSLLNCALEPIGGGARECGSKTAKQGKCIVRPASWVAGAPSNASLKKARSNRMRSSK